ncbi:hypothetical protein ER57_18295 [Smithella sp. SCADC]|nr:hypothetical protein ER57_18295 [Smithella sp. SCADC]
MHMTKQSNIRKWDNPGKLNLFTRKQRNPDNGRGAINIFNSRIFFIIIAPALFDYKKIYFKYTFLILKKIFKIQTAP